MGNEEDEWLGSIISYYSMGLNSHTYSSICKQIGFKEINGIKI